jgi:hypothetical protein
MNGVVSPMDGGGLSMDGVCAKESGAAVEEISTAVKRKVEQLQAHAYDSETNVKHALGPKGEVPTYSFTITFSQVVENGIGMEKISLCSSVVHFIQLSTVPPDLPVLCNNR